MTTYSNESCPYSLRRALISDLPYIIDLLVSEPRSRLKQLLIITLLNTYVTCTWFVGSTIAFLLFILSPIHWKFNQEKNSMQFYAQPLYTYVSISFIAGLIIFLGCFMQAIKLYSSRYAFAFILKANITKIENKINGNRTGNHSETENEFVLAMEGDSDIISFWNKHQFYVAYHHSSSDSLLKSRDAILGCISICLYSEYDQQMNSVQCNENESDFFIFSNSNINNKFHSISAHETVVFSYLAINEKLTGNIKNLRDDIYHQLLKLGSSSIEMRNNEAKNENLVKCAIIECDDFLEWQHKILIEETVGFTFCGERIDVSWNIFNYQANIVAYPNAKYLFVRNFV